METAVSSIEDTEMATNVPAEDDTKNNVTGPGENETEGAVTSETRFVTLDESVLKSFNLCGDDGQPNIVVVYSEGKSSITYMYKCTCVCEMLLI